jgi:hypothetical protein
MFAWLYRYVFRRLGIVLVIGMITILWLAISSQRAQEHAPAVPTERP